MITHTTSVGSTPAPAEPERHRAITHGPAAVQSDTLSTTNASRLKAALEQTPEIRPEVVARAEELAVNPSYPPIAIIEKLATMIATSNDLSNAQE